MPVLMFVSQALVTTFDTNGVVTSEVFVKDLKLLVQDFTVQTTKCCNLHTSKTFVTETDIHGIPQSSKVSSNLSIFVCSITSFVSTHESYHISATNVAMRQI
jgi:hypothetical protein